MKPGHITDAKGGLSERDTFARHVQRGREACPKALLQEADELLAQRHLPLREREALLASP